MQDKNKPNFYQLEKETGISRATLLSRWKSSDRDKALIRPVKKKKSDLPKWVTYKSKDKNYLYSRTLNGVTYNKSAKTLDEILSISDEINDYVAMYGKFPEYTDDRVKFDYDNLVGQVFGYLTVTEVYYKNNRRYLMCRCDCGRLKSYTASELIDGSVISCGHLEGWALRERNEELKELQRQSDKPLSTNQSTGHKYISYNKSKGAYDFEIKRSGARLRRRFKKLQDAIDFKYKILDEIKNNGGKIPKEAQNEI